MPTLLLRMTFSPRFWGCKKMAPNLLHTKMCQNTFLGRPCNFLMSNKAQSAVFFLVKQPKVRAMNRSNGRFPSLSARVSFPKPLAACQKYELAVWAEQVVLCEMCQQVHSCSWKAQSLEGPCPGSQITK